MKNIKKDWTGSELIFDELSVICFCDLNKNFTNEVVQLWISCLFGWKSFTSKDFKGWFLLNWMLDKKK